MEGQSSPKAAARRSASGRREAPVELPPAAASSPAFRPIHTRRAFEEICQRIREEIARGVLRPGDKLPAERDLAQQLGVSRNVLREALRSLEMAGLLRLQKGVRGGAFIREGNTDRMDDVIRDLLSLGSIDVKQLAEARIHIMDVVVRLACKSAAKADLDALDANADRTEAATSEGRFLDRVECSREFYRLLAAATKNQVLSMIVHAVTEIHMRFVHARVAARGMAMPKLVEKRRQFLAAVRARDAESATRMMRTHLEAVHRTRSP